MKTINLKIVMLSLSVSLSAVPALADGEPPPAGSFTIVVMPDTQKYTISESGCLASRAEFDLSHCPLHDIFFRQTEWMGVDVV